LAPAAASGVSTLQQQQQQQLHVGGCDVSIADELPAGDAAVDSTDDVSWGFQQMAQTAVLPGDERDAATAAAAGIVSAYCSSSGPSHGLHNNSSSGSSNAKHHSSGKVLLQFSFWVQELQPCSTAELKSSAPDAAQHPTPADQLARNKLLLQLTEGLYTLSPRPQSPNPEAAPQLSPMASAEEWVGPEGFDSLRLGLGRQLSGPLAAVAQQQQLYR
jgi:hypothetical protein